MIRITARTEMFHAIKFVEAIRRATGVGLKQGLEYVRRLGEGEAIAISPVEGVTEDELVARLQDCGVVFEVISPQVDE